MRIVSFKIQDSLLDELDRICEETGYNRSELIRKAIVWLVNAYRRGPRRRIAVEL